MTPRLQVIRSTRDRLAGWFLRRRLLARPVTVVADDCWAGRLYSDLRLPCRSPFIGMGVRAPEYLELLAHFHEPGVLEVLGTSLHPERGYPILHTRHAAMHGLHYGSLAEFRQRFERRVRSIAWDNLRFKIDLGKPTCGPAEIKRWNELRPPGALALHPPAPAFALHPPHAGLPLPRWHFEGDKQFLLSARRFDVLAWLNHGRIENSTGYRLAQFLLLDRQFLPRCRELLMPTPETITLPPDAAPRAPTTSGSVGTV